MTAAQSPAVYDELIDLLAETADADRVLSFRISQQMQSRLDELLEKNRIGSLSDLDASELATYEHIEHIVRLLKATVLRRQAS